MSVLSYHMKPPRLFTTIVSVMIAGTLLTSCDDKKPTKRTDRSAAPGRFSTIVGTGPTGGPESDPDWFEDPVDLATAQDGSILALTKEYGRVFSLKPDGSRHQEFSLPNKGEALSMAVQSNGTITVAQKVTSGLTIEEAKKGQPPTEVAKFPVPKDPQSVHLTISPDGHLLLLKDGRILERQRSGKFESLPRVGAISPKRPTLAAVTDGDSLLTVLPNEIVWIRNNKVIKKVSLDSPIYPEDGAAVVPDGAGGAYLTGRSSYVSHISAPGRDGSILLGTPARIASVCGSGRISGPTGDAQQRPLGEATALGVTHSQLYVADPLCHRILAIGLPAKEYFPRGH
jgi:hypothetical protein